MNVVVIGPNLPDQSKGSFHVHAYNCADTRKSQYRCHSHDASTGYGMASKTEVAEMVYGDFIPGEMSVDDALSDIYFFPCVAALPLV